jgi:hypothetical protein
MPHPSSSPAQAGDPVNIGGSNKTEAAVVTGCPAFAGHDGVG